MHSRRSKRRGGLQSALYLALSFAAAMVSGCGGSDTVVKDLIADFPQARAQPNPAAFEIADVTINGDTRHALSTGAQTRLTYHVTLPSTGRLALHVGLVLRPDVWTKPGDGVLFMIAVSDGNRYDERYKAVIDPAGHPDARRWHDVTLSLDEYAGLTVDVILNTRAGAVAGATTENDVAVWGSPTVMKR